MKLTFLGHAAFLLELNDTKIAIDPFITDSPVAPCKAGDISANYILVTHGHFDHLGDAIEMASRNDGIVVGVSEIAKYCAARDVSSHGMHIGGGYDFGSFHLKLTMALHGSSMGTPAEYLGNPCGFLITAEGKTIYHAGDTGLFGDMELIGRLNKIDYAFLPIGDNFTMGPSDALEAIKMLKPQNVIPMHYNTWDLIKQNPFEFKAAVEKELKIPVSILDPGDSLTI